jgi:hypothetical protein
MNREYRTLESQTPARDYGEGCGLEREEERRPVAHVPAHLAALRQNLQRKGEETLRHAEQQRLGRRVVYLRAGAE